MRNVHLAFLGRAVVSTLFLRGKSWSRRSGLNRRPADYEREESKSKKTQEVISDTKNKDLVDPAPLVDPPESS